MHALAILICCVQEPAVDAARHPWAKFKEGSWVRFATTATLAGVEMPGGAITQTVKAKSSDVVTVTVEADGAARDQQIPLRPRGADASTDRGVEDVAIDGTTFRCRVRETTMKGVTTRSWLCQDAPGGIVKMETTSGAMKDAGALVKRREVLKIAGRDVACWVFETKAERSGEAMTTTVWQSSDVPGFVVKVVTRIPGSFESVQEVVEFEVK